MPIHGVMWTKSQSMKWMRHILQPKGLGKIRRSPSTAEVRDFFNNAALDEEHYPSTIDPRIYHVKLMLQHLGNLNEKCVADVGCGKGRFAQIVRVQYPSASVHALDVAEAMLAYVS